MDCNCFITFKLTVFRTFCLFILLFLSSFLSDPLLSSSLILHPGLWQTWPTMGGWTDWSSPSPWSWSNCSSRARLYRPPCRPSWSRPPSPPSWRHLPASVSHVSWRTPRPYRDFGENKEHHLFSSLSVALYWLMNGTVCRDESLMIWWMMVRSHIKTSAVEKLLSHHKRERLKAIVIEGVLNS